MESQITIADLKKIEAGIREKYNQVAQNPDGQFKYPTGKKGLEALNYEKALIEQLPDEVVSFYCGVGNPFSLGPLDPGEQVLDLGCGAGVDTILAAMMVGPAGSAVGVDIVPEMIARAETNLRAMDIENASFQNTSGESLSFDENSFNVVISNGAINLIPDKEKALSEIRRVLKPAGRLMVADQIAAGSVQKDLKARLANWFK
jgi:SAM-dependent methyltransferase